MEEKSMSKPPGRFFVEFSIRGLVQKNQYWSEASRHTREGGSGGVGGGRGVVLARIGGVAGSSAERIGVGAGALRSRQETFAFAIKCGDAGGACGDHGSLKDSGKSEAAEFDGARFMEQLRSDVEAEMVDSGLTITSKDTFGSAGFGFDYAEPGSQGRIRIICRISLDYRSFHISASLEEKRTDGNSAVWLETPWRRNPNAHPPEGNYYVVTFPGDDIRAHTRRFYYRGKEALESSEERIRRLRITRSSESRSAIEHLPYAEVYMWQALPADLGKPLGAAGRQFGVPAEYEQYKIVYFLNEVALKMYRDAGEEFVVLKTVSSDKMLEIPGPQLRGPYLPEGN
jgi:hypothetical protein